MGRRFHQASAAPFGFVDEAFLAVMDKCAEAGGLFQTEGGFLAGMIVPTMCDPNWKMAVELAWWAEDRQGLRLLGDFEKWARKNGANEIRMTTLAALPAADSIMHRRGYKPAETSWTKGA